MKIHVLAGDALAESFKKTGIAGEVIVCRECLVEGDVKSARPEDFWQMRARFIETTYGAKKEDYFSDVVAEFEKLKTLATAGTQINLWFEYELFCQANLWFCLYFLRESKAKIFRVAPVVRAGNDIWQGFGGLDAKDLEKCFAGGTEFSESDIRLGADLWTAYQNSDYQTLEKVSETESPRFPFLKEVCRAEIEKNARPAEVLRKIVAGGKTDFAEIFPAFKSEAGVYGFGDSQVKRILAEI